MMEQSARDVIAEAFYDKRFWDLAGMGEYRDVADEAINDLRTAGYAIVKLPEKQRFYEAAHQDEDGVIHPFGNGRTDLLSVEYLCEVLNTPNPRKPHPERVYFVAVQERSDWKPLNPTGEDS